LAKVIEVHTHNGTKYHVTKRHALAMRREGRAIYLDESQNTMVEIKGERGQWLPIGPRSMGCVGPAFKTLQLV
jgi:hypothetical protein